MSAVKRILVISLIGGAACWILSALMFMLLSPGMTFFNGLINTQAMTMGICTFAGVLVGCSILAANGIIALNFHDR
ncbi:MAG: hypothetical protein IJ121_08045 [Eubacterium sp.]|nr:hypothetical protein [Eubacterium sp.]